MNLQEIPRNLADAEGSLEDIREALRYERSHEWPTRYQETSAKIRELESRIPAALAAGFVSPYRGMTSAIRYIV